MGLSPGPRYLNMMMTKKIYYHAKIYLNGKEIWHASGDSMPYLHYRISRDMTALIKPGVTLVVYEREEEKVTF